MALTKAECVVLMSLITQSVGIEALTELLGEDKVKKLDAIAIDLAGNTTPNDMALLGPQIIEKLTNSLLEVKGE